MAVLPAVLVANTFNEPSNAMREAFAATIQEMKRLKQHRPVSNDRWRLICELWDASRKGQS